MNIMKLGKIISSFLSSDQSLKVIKTKKSDIDTIFEHYSIPHQFRPIALNIVKTILDYAKNNQKIYELLKQHGIHTENELLIRILTSSGSRFFTNPDEMDAIEIDLALSEPKKLEPIREIVDNIDFLKNDKALLKRIANCLKDYVKAFENYYSTINE